MAFKVGETVVYPHHGAALIEAIEEHMSRECRRLTCDPRSHKGI